MTRRPGLLNLRILQSDAAGQEVAPTNSQVSRRSHTDSETAFRGALSVTGYGRGDRTLLYSCRAYWSRCSHDSHRCQTRSVAARVGRGSGREGSHNLLQIIGRIDEMGNRIDDLEKSIGDLMEQVSGTLTPWALNCSGSRSLSALHASPAWSSPPRHRQTLRPMDHLDKIMDDKCVRNDLLKPSGSRVAAIASEITTAGDDGCRLCSDWARNLWGPGCLELPEAHFFAPFLCF